MIPLVEHKKWVFGDFNIAYTVLKVHLSGYEIFSEESHFFKWNILVFISDE